MKNSLNPSTLVPIEMNVTVLAKKVTHTATLKAHHFEFAPKVIHREENKKY